MLYTKEQIDRARGIESVGAARFRREEAEVLNDLVAKLEGVLTAIEDAKSSMMLDTKETDRLDDMEGLIRDHRSDAEAIRDRHAEGL